MYKLYNGDCLSVMQSQTFLDAIKDKKVVIVTDPPFNIGYHYKGTTGIACLKHNVDFIGIELDETYFNIAKDRLNGINKKGQMNLFDL